MFYFLSVEFITDYQSILKKKDLSDFSLRQIWYRVIFDIFLLWRLKRQAIICKTGNAWQEDLLRSGDQLTMALQR